MINTPPSCSGNKTSLLSRGFAVVYSLFAYGVGSVALFWFFFAAIGIAPYSLSVFKADNQFVALTVNTFLVLLFSLQHTIMARKSFKQKWIQIIPEHLERSTFVLASGILTTVVLWHWQTLPGIIWSIENEYARLATLGLAVFGVAYVLVTTLVTNHFELLGLRQAWLYATDKSYTPVDFKRQWVYRYSRHPMMLGLLIVFWATPDMSVTRLALAALLTIYLFIGIQFEERSLVQEFGEKYEAYRKDIGMFFTFR